MNDQEIEVLRSVFKKYDTESIGKINLSQFILFVTRLSKYIEELHGIEISKAGVVFNLLDADRDGYLTFDDFLRWWDSTDGEPYSFFIGEKSRLLEKAYNLYSNYTSTTGNMTYSQFENMMDMLDIPHTEDAFDDLDTDGDGLLSFSEFIDWLKWF
jgi:Ca2+-binding EF-hand superfamily protein